MMIEWDATHYYEPQQYGFYDYCRDHAIKFNGQVSPFLIIVGKQELHSLEKFLSQDTSREHAGILVGTPFLDPTTSYFFVAIHRVITAPFSLGNATHLQFTAEDWSYFAEEMGKKHNDEIIVGWFHSHPGLGVFMSAIDQATQSAFFNNPWNIAIVVDPIQNYSGWFVGGDCDKIQPQQVVSYLEVNQEVESSHQCISKVYSLPPIQMCLNRRWLLSGAIFLFIIWFLLRDNGQR